MNVQKVVEDLIKEFGEDKVRRMIDNLEALKNLEGEDGKGKIKYKAKR